MEAGQHPGDLEAAVHAPRPVGASGLREGGARSRNWARSRNSPFRLQGRPAIIETFLPASYQFILYGMNAATDFAPPQGRHPEAATAHQTFAKVAAASGEALKHLPPHRQLVEAYYARAS